jgi:hypothetical protein
VHANASTFYHFKKTMNEQGTQQEQNAQERRKDAHNLRGQGVEQAKYRWSQNQPVRVPAFAAALGVSYAVARRLIKMPGFPLVAGYVCREEYERWRIWTVQQRMTAEAPDQPSAASQPCRRAGKSGGSSPKRGSRVSSPRRAERLREATA